MNNQFHFNQNLTMYFYLKYKQYLLPVGVILGCIIIFLVWITPQFQTYLGNRDTVQSDEETLHVIQQNISTLSLLKENDITTNLKTASLALPAEKDFTGILNAISQAAQLSNVGLGDYTFQIGDLFGKNSNTQNGQLTIQINLSLLGNIPATKRFMDTLSKEFPLSEITAIRIKGDNGADITALFFYKPLSNVNVVATIPIQQLSLPQQKLLKSLTTEYEKPIDTALPKKLVATESALPQ